MCSVHRSRTTQLLVDGAKGGLRVVAVLDRSSLRAAVDETVAVDPASLSDLETADALFEISAEIDRLEAQRARLAWSGHQRGIGAADGSPSTQAWLRKHTGMREGDARTAINAGEVGEMLPKVGAAWRDGVIHSGAAKTIAGARVEGHDLKLRALEDLFLGLARADDMRELRRACAHFRDCAKADGSDPRAHDGLTISSGYDGRTILNGELSSAAAETVVTALHAFTDPPADDDDRTPARRRADGLVAMAEAALANLHGTDPEDGPVRALPAASIVVDWTTLTGGTFGRLDGDYTGTLNKTDVERLLCDCTVSRVVTGPDGLPLDVGRSRRTIPPQLRRALRVRDQGCRYPGCTRPHGWTRAHHVIHWKDGGTTVLVNLVSLCDHHHHVVHLPGWTAKFEGHTFTVFQPDGTQVT
jgi:hypothetical protein